MFTDGVAGFNFQRFVNPCVLVFERFFLNKDWAQVAVACECADCGFVDIAVVVSEPVEHVSDYGWGGGGIEFVGFHSINLEGGAVKT